MNRTLGAMREWIFPLMILGSWAVGFGYTMVRLGEAHRTHERAAVARAAPAPAPASPLFASAR